MVNALILGAGSDIGMAVARALSAQGYAVQLAARNVEALEATGLPKATTHTFDVLDTDGFAEFLGGLGGVPDVVVSAIGLMGDQQESEARLDDAALVMRSNFEGPALILGEIGNRMEARGSGVIVGISSVAGERGRASNYVYGSAKAGFTAFLSGLRNRLATKGVQVMTVLPGFVNTKMTAGMDLPGKLTAEPDEVASAIVAGIAKGRDVIYVKPIWRLVMAIIRALPEAVFKKTSF